MELSPTTLRSLSRLIHNRTGIVIGDDKAYLLKHRLASLVESCGLGDFDGLVRELESARPNARINERVIDAITTGETAFFRDAWLFDELRRVVLPQCIQRLRDDRTRRRIRILSAGSSAGQEAYSLAMLVREIIDTSAGELDERHFTIVACDISTDAIRLATTGCYGSAEVSRGLDEARLRKHFIRERDHWKANDSLRQLVHFRHSNLLRLPADIGKFDLILCRNVLIYFDQTTKTGVCKALVESMHEGAWLAIGAAESLHGMGLAVESQKLGRAVVYRKPLPKPADSR